MTETRNRRRPARPAGPAQASAQGPAGAGVRPVRERDSADKPELSLHAPGCKRPRAMAVWWASPSGWFKALWRCPWCGVCWPREAEP
jgi:hypothetical protein